MVDVFNDLTYAIKYEQLNLDLNNVYNTFAKTAISLAKIPDHSYGLDLCCGTGVSTYELLNNVPETRVVGIDRAENFLEMAKVKFGISNKTNLVFQMIKEKHPYPEVIKEKCHPKDLESHLREEIKSCEPFMESVSFYCRDASDMSNISRELFDYVLASQCIHWFRKKSDPEKPEIKPNLAYEKKVLEQVRNNLKTGGLFIFNTSGADYKFEDTRMNEIHFYKHPFYKTFLESLYAELDSKILSDEGYTFDHNEIERVMKENGFKIKDRLNIELPFEPNNLIESCLIAGQMSIFQEKNIDDISADERENILKRAIEQTIEKQGGSLTEIPVIETGVHYVTEKV